MLLLFNEISAAFSVTTVSVFPETLLRRASSRAAIFASEGIVARLPEHNVSETVREILLLRKIIFVIMGIFIAGRYIRIRHQFGGSVSQMERNRQVAIFLTAFWALFIAI